MSRAIYVTLLTFRVTKSKETKLLLAKTIEHEEILKNKNGRCLYKRSIEYH